MKNVIAAVMWTTSMTLMMSACNLQEDRIQSTEELKKEMNNRQLKKISQGEITTEAFNKGQIIVQRISDTLKTRLSNAVKTQGVDGAIKYCNIEAIPLTKSLSEHMYADIARISLKNRNPKNTPSSDLEKQILEAYQYSADENVEIIPNVQILEKTILYTAPIFTNGMCLKCHGEPGTDIAEEHVALIKELYPDGKAMGYKDQQLRGMWTVRFDKKELIKNMKSDVN